MIDTDGHTTRIVETTLPPGKDTQIYVDNTPGLWYVPEDGSGMKLNAKTLGIAALFAIGIIFLIRR